MSLEEAKKKALSLLDKRDYSRGELIRKLTDKGFEAADAEAAAERFVDLGYINDASYAAMIVRHYCAKGFGPARLREELRRRYIPREMWEEALDEAPDQENTIDALLRMKLKTSEPDRDELRKASDALRRRGFSWEDVRDAVERYNSERENI